MTTPKTAHGDMGTDRSAHLHGGNTDHAQQPSPSPGETERPPLPPTFGGHNQMMVGQETIFLSHLPMFMFDPQRHEHSFQVVLEVTLSGPGDPQTVYASDRRQHPHERLYTMEPEPFEMVELDPRHPRRTALTGDIYRGHLERGGEKILSGAVARVVNTVHFHAFDPRAQPLAQLEYLLFGKGPERFLAHVITKPPDFDQILSVTLGGPSVSDEDLRRGVHITIPGRANTPHTRIRAGERVRGQAQLAGAPAGQPLALQLEAGIEFYFEEGELGDPALPAGQPGAFTMKQTTPEERAAGF